MVEPPTLADRKLVRRFPESPDLLLRYEPPTEKFANERVSEVGAGDGMLLGVHSGRQQLRRC